MTASRSAILGYCILPSQTQENTSAGQNENPTRSQNNLALNYSGIKLKLLRENSAPNYQNGNADI
ncbi:hypothetical protein VA599_21095 [Chromobacterium sp. TRC.1.1.SA]|uniref:Uncharacterized protein n=1 Tax=Chromobacterium indicum TaxID=3110228 RepID=A0ABV0CT28_9NEIS